MVVGSVILFYTFLILVQVKITTIYIEYEVFLDLMLPALVTEPLV